jgi:CubicO group peptidase (beta-lactamase class C family)
MIGSITKEFTHVLGFVLEEKDVFSLDDTVSQVLTDFRGPIGRVTLQQLMDHTGGLPDIIDRSGGPIAYSVEYDYESVSRDELVDRAELAELISEPGHSEEYSNLGYQLLAAIYEVATGETYPDLLRRHVYGPAGINDTDFWFSDTEQRSFANGCRANNVHWGNPVGDKMWGESGPSWNLIGAGGLLSTAESLGRFFEGIGSGVYFDDPEQLEKYKSSRMVFSKSRQQRVMGPAGSNGIFNAVAYWADGDRFNVILMTNRADYLAENGLFQDILRLFPADSFAAPDKD